MSKHYKNKLPPFVPMLCSTLDSPAWKATTYGARVMYLALRRRIKIGRNTGWLSYRDACQEIGTKSKSDCERWFAELEHYGFIVKVSEGALGVDGVGIAPHWRLTELGQSPNVTKDGLPEPPTRDFLKWDGTKFRIPSRKSGHPVPNIRTPLSRKSRHPKLQVSRISGHREPPSVLIIGT
jgi:hypothetical protein